MCIETSVVFASANACAKFYDLDPGLLGRMCDKGIAKFPRKLPGLFLKEFELKNYTQSGTYSFLN